MKTAQPVCKRALVRSAGGRSFKFYDSSFKRALPREERGATVSTLQAQGVVLIGEIATRVSFTGETPVLPSLMPRRRGPTFAGLISFPRSSTGIGKLAGDHVAAVAAIGGEVAPVDRPNAGLREEFRHPHEAGIRKIHRPVGIFRGECQHGGQLFFQNKTGIEHQIPPRNQAQEACGFRKKTARLGENRIAGEKRCLRTKGRNCLGVKRIVAMEKGHDQSGIGDSLHRLVAARARRRSRAESFVAGPVSPW